MKVAVDYNIVRSDTMYALIKNVNTAIRDGFEPLGGVTMVPTEDGYLFMQAVAKYEDAGR